MSAENSLATPSADQVPEIVEGGSQTEALEPELLERIEAAAVKAVVEYRSETHSGPMPAPSTYREYDDVLPGTALSIRNEFEANGRHVRAMEEKALSGQIDNDRENRKVAERLVWGAFALILGLALTGHDSAAVAVAVTTVGAVIAGFVSGRWPKKAKQQIEEDD